MNNCTVEVWYDNEYYVCDCAGEECSYLLEDLYAMDEEVEVDPECYEEHHDLDCSSYFFIEGMNGCMYDESYDMCNEEQLDCNATFGVYD